MRQLGHTDINVYPMCLGGNTFGWTSDRQESFDVMDAYVAAGGNFIDTADVYSEWSSGGGGVSETIIGQWMSARKNREQMVIATKVGSLSTRPGLSADNIKLAVEDSLRRLHTDYIDVYFSHRDFDDTPLEETLEAYSELVSAGKVRVIGASNYSADRLEQALKVSEQNSWPRYEVVQNHYNLMERSDYEGAMAQLVEQNDLASVPYFALAAGFLTGKYRDGATVDSARANGAEKYANARGRAVIDALEQIANKHTTTIASVALAWLDEQPSITAPIASARTTGQLSEIIPMAHIKLSQNERQSLSDASAS